MHRPHIVIAALCIQIGLTTVAPATATEIHADSAITAVTVFVEGADVTREATVDLPGGTSVVVFGNLPAGIPTDSLRVRGEGAAPVTILRVETGREILSKPASDREAQFTAEIQSLHDRHGGLNDQITALREQLTFIRSLAKLAGPDVKEGLLTGTPGNWPSAWRAVGEGAAAALGQIRVHQIAQRELGREIGRLKKELRRIHTGAVEHGVARVHVQTESTATATSVRLALSYQVRNASWRPTYDARLDPQTATVELTLNGEVRQHTGEDWNDARLTLSTARPEAGAAMAEPSAWFIDFVPPPEEFGQRFQSLLLRSAVRLDQPLEMDTVANRKADVQLLAKSVPEVAAPAVAMVVATAFSLVYEIPGTHRVPADGEAHRFTADMRQFATPLEVRTHPRVEAKAYLYAVLANDGAPLPSGNVTLFRDGTLVGRGTLPEVRPGAEHRLAFGVDDRVRVIHHVDTDRGGTEGLFRGKRRVERRYRLTVENHHDRPVHVTVYDRLPIPQDEAIGVKYLDGWALSPTETDVDGQKGVVAWRDTWAPAQKRVIPFGYAVTFPKERSLVGF